MNEDVECLEPLNCHMCIFECFSQNELKTHLRIHSRFKLLMCTICKEKFSQMNNLERHCSFFHGGRGHGQTSHIDTKFGQSVGNGVQTGGISGMKKDDTYSNAHVTVRKRGRPRKTEKNNTDQTFDNSMDTEDVICLSDQVNSANVNNKKLVQSDERGEKSGMNKEDIHSGTTRRRRGRPRKNENKIIHSKLDNSAEEVICLDDNATTSNVKGGQTNSLQCYICFKQFVCFDDLQVHLNIHTQETPYVCLVCQCGFREWDALKTHSLIHTTNDKKIPVTVCNFCETGFVDPNVLESHSKGHLSKKPWRCNHCHELFAEESLLQSHRKISHAGENHYICHDCKKRFKFKPTLIKHLDLHTGAKSYKCDVCYKVFGWKINLKAHTRIHTGERPFKCNICDKGFIQKQHLVVHQISHTGDRPFKCNMCDKSYTQMHNLILHTRTSHKGEGRFGHNILTRKFSVRCNVKTEQKAASVGEPSTSTRHETLKLLEFDENCENEMANISECASKTNEERKSLICNYCKTGFLESKAMKIHTQSSHRGEHPFTCNHCPGKFENHVKLQSHHRISHAGKKHWICDKCNKRFKSSSQLNRHLLIHTGEKPFKCNICKKRFNHIIHLRTHSRVHSEEKPFICGFCHQRFKYSNQYKIHVQKCLPKSHEISESSFGEEENVEKEEVLLNEISDEKCALEIQVGKNAQEFCNDGIECLTPKISAEIFTQKPCCSSSLSSQAIPITQNGQRQFGQIEIEGKSGWSSLSEHFTDIDTTTCSPLSEENRCQQWASFLKVFNVKVARKF